MKTITSLFSKTIAGGVVLLVPMMASAQSAGAPAFKADGGKVGESITNIISFVNTYLIPFILALGFLFFVWAIFVYFVKGGDNEQERETGKKYLVYSLFGFVLIFIFWGLVQLLINFTNMGGAKAPPTPTTPTAGTTK